MDLIASFSSQRISIANFFIITGLLGDISPFFPFDTGAACSIVGVNSFFGKDRKGNYSANKIAFERILKEELDSLGILPRDDGLKTANGQTITAYPSVCHNIKIHDITLDSFYFDISFDDVNTPLLGCSFSDDCAYSHSINGHINITGMKNNPGEEFYKNNTLLDFDIVRKRYETKR